MSYYHSLNPFRESFRKGLPVLTYHKLGPRPRGVRIKGLYVGTDLFAQQLSELHAAGFSTTTLAEVMSAGDAQKHIVLTFDDGYVSALQYGLRPLADNQYRAMQFLVAGCLGKTNLWDRDAGEIQEPLMDAGLVREWLAAGHDIGSHSLTHPHLTRIGRRQAREEIHASKRILEDLFGRAIDYFCYPYGDWNEEISELVKGAGYRAAFTTTAGINTPGQSPFALKRLTARYPSRSLKAVWSRMRTAAT
ncbi:MAG: polysaccharide deacetylase family protein [Gammaproteobacteria bacterium]|nr:polysaccharide deacetylase family protein [Gammaproteobacteria bacterium]MDE2346534.1 polysaccharide deacetylase family protein [Gammaproteobacteria bacterium]